MPMVGSCLAEYMLPLPSSHRRSLRMAQMASCRHAQSHCSTLIASLHMAYDVKCRLYTELTERDAFGQPIGEPPLWRSGVVHRYLFRRLAKNLRWACGRRASGGAHTHWREGIEQCRFVEFDGKRRAIVGIVPEGRKHLVHITTYTDDVGYGE